MATCVVKDCNTALNESLKCFKFPRSRLLRKAWLNAVPVARDITTDAFVCNKHFTDDDFEVIRSKRVLRTHAVPRVYDTSNTQTEEESVAKSEMENVNNETELEEAKNEKEEAVSQVNGDEADLGLVETHSGNDCRDDKQESPVRTDSQEDRNKPEESDPKDIEEIIKHYHIRQDISKRKRENGFHCSVNGESVRELPQNPFTDQNNIFSDIIEAAKNQNEIAKFNYQLSAHQVEFISDLVEKLAPNTNQRGVEIQPTYVEVSTKDKTAGNRSDSPQDCYMLLENVQVELDPSNFFHDEEDEVHEVDRDDNRDLLKRKLVPTDSQLLVNALDDPISLVTSSDEDDVIIQEPHIDTVEVSDETDEDDMPLVRLLKSKQPKQPKKKSKSVVNPMASIWGVHYQCKECEYKTTDISLYNAHSRTHVFLRVCELCNYTTSSKVQYVRHKRKHKEEKRFKCHQCGYTAKHNMSLVYHLKTHSEPRTDTDGRGESVFNCDKCNFKSTNMYKFKTHVCFSGVKWHSCERCSYTTRRRSDLRRHSARMHNREVTDEWLPP